MAFLFRLSSERNFSPVLVSCALLVLETLGSSPRRFRQSRTDCLLSSRPCWMVLGQGESISIFCVGSCISAVRLENGDGDGSCCITAVGCWSSAVIFAIDPTPAQTTLELSLSFASANVLRDRTRHATV